MKHPSALFGGPHEHAIIDLSNRGTSRSATSCARLPSCRFGHLTTRAYFPGLLSESLEELQRQGLAEDTSNGWVELGQGQGHRGGSPERALLSQIFKVLCEGRLLETLDKTRAYREAHAGAVLLHEGETYVVEQLDLTNRIVSVSKKNVDYHTEPMKTVDLRTVKELEKRAHGALVVSFGIVEVVEQVRWIQDAPLRSGRGNREP